MKPMAKIRVALADDHPVVLAGVKALVQAAPEMELVGEAVDGIGALELIRSTMPDVAVIDVSMPDMNGVELTRRVVAEMAGVRILVLTVHEDRAYVQLLLNAGARGYLLKRSAADELVRAIRAIFADGVYIDPAIAGKVLHAPAASDPAATTGVLSEREEEVLRLAARGFTNKEVAARMELSIKTVETYRARAAEKLGLRTRADIVRYGVARGWLDEP